MKIKLTVQKRLVAFGILNGIKNFSLADWGILDEAKKTLSFSEEDKKKYKIEKSDVKDPDTGAMKQSISWDPEMGEVEEDFEIPSDAYDLLKKELQKLDSKNNLGDEHIPLAKQLLE